MGATSKKAHEEKKGSWKRVAVRIKCKKEMVVELEKDDSEKWGNRGKQKTKGMIQKKIKGDVIEERKSDR